MHELPITKRILDIALAHARGRAVRRIVRIHLRIGDLSDLENEWIQRYFDHLSRGTLAENAQLAITRSPIVMRCRTCGRSFEVGRTEWDRVRCPACGGSGIELVSGREYLVENMVVL
jgi:hydrogenase nickel incorporation protein HypA/HybF